MSTSGFGGLGDDLRRFAMDSIYEAAAEQVAEVMRSEGRTTADGVELEIPTDDPSVELDVERVRSMANAILAAD